ncbi:hypothetical protein TSMEX_010817 [Taenia solium]|eukprot:TsM_001035700 transcript=TsM_001035700 gene=TsM_001035700
MVPPSPSPLLSPYSASLISTKICDEVPLVTHSPPPHSSPPTVLTVGREDALHTLHLHPVRRLSGLTEWIGQNGSCATLGTLSECAVASVLRGKQDMREEGLIQWPRCDVLESRSLLDAEAQHTFPNTAQQKLLKASAVAAGSATVATIPFAKQMNSESIVRVRPTVGDTRHINGGKWDQGTIEGTGMRID